MRYIIFSGERDKIILLSHPLSPSSEAYLREIVFPALHPLSDDEYTDGAGRLLSTAARSSYVLAGEDVYWCIDCKPGLQVVKFSSNGTMKSVALTSPNPEFAGREATAEERASYDEDAENPQYDLVFDAWDAQFEEEELKKWTAADDATISCFESALTHANSLGEKMAEAYRQQGD